MGRNSYVTILLYYHANKIVFTDIQRGMSESKNMQVWKLKDKNNLKVYYDYVRYLVKGVIICYFYFVHTRTHSISDN